MEKQYRILAVDDEKFNLLLLKTCLKNTGHTVEACDNALQALSIFKKNDFDVVLLDIMMDGIDGFESRDLIRSTNRNVPIIFLTSLVDDLDSTIINRVTEDKNSYYLNKSFTRETLLAKIEEAVSSYRTETEALQLFKRIDSDLALAADVQRIMLPRWCAVKGGMVYSYLYEPAFRCSGDLLKNVILPDGRSLVIVGDIAGHGVQAALYMTAIQSFIKTIFSDPANGEIQLEEILNYLNNFFFYELNGENYMTCLLARFDFVNNIVEFHSAGHPDFICCSSRTGKVRETNPGSKFGSIPIGWVKDYRYESSETVCVNFDDDDVFLFFTDGLLDIINPNAEQPVINDEEFRHLAGALAQESSVFTLPFRIRNTLTQLGYTRADDDVFLGAVSKRASGNGRLRILAPQLSDVEKLLAECERLVSAPCFVEPAKNLLKEFLTNVIQQGFNSNKVGRHGIVVYFRTQGNREIIEVIDRGQQWNKEGSIKVSRSLASSIARSHYHGINQTIFTLVPTEEE